MVDHVISGQKLGTLCILCFTIAGVLAVLTVAICLWNYFLARGWIGRQQPVPENIELTTEISLMTRKN
jgi:hypothetical protein